MRTASSGKMTLDELRAAVEQAKADHEFARHMFRRQQDQKHMALLRTLAKMLSEAQGMWIWRGELYSLAASIPAHATDVRRVLILPRIEEGE